MSLARPGPSRPGPHDGPHPGRVSKGRAPADGLRRRQSARPASPPRGAVPRSSESSSRQGRVWGGAGHFAHFSTSRLFRPRSARCCFCPPCTNPRWQCAPVPCRAEKTKRGTGVTGPPQRSLHLYGHSTVTAPEVCPTRRPRIERTQRSRHSMAWFFRTRRIGSLSSLRQAARCRGGRGASFSPMLERHSWLKYSGLVSDSKTGTWKVSTAQKCHTPHCGLHISARSTAIQKFAVLAILQQ